MPPAGEPGSLFTYLLLWKCCGEFFVFFHLIKKAVFSLHGAPDLNHRYLTAFESHDPASMGTLRIPCDIIMKAFMAGGWHGLLAAGYWSLVTPDRYSTIKGPRGFCPLSSADPGYKPAVAYSPASARRAPDPVDHRIYWLQ